MHLATYDCAEVGIVCKCSTKQNKAYRSALAMGKWRLQTQEGAHGHTAGKATGPILSGGRAGSKGNVHTGASVSLGVRTLTGITHGAEDVLSDSEDGVSGLVVPASRPSPCGMGLHVLQQLIEGLGDSCGCGSHPSQQLPIFCGCLGGRHTALHSLGYQSSGLHQLFLADR